MHHQPTIRVIFVAALASALLTAACEVSELTPSGPTRIASLVPPSVVTLGIRPSPLFRRPVFGAVCPLGQLFLVPFELVVGTRGGGPLFLNQVRMQFVDSLGVAGPRVTIPLPDLTSRFGTTQVPALGSRAFPFSFAFGCSTEPVGTFSVSVEMVDERGATTTSTSSVAVR